MGLLHDLNAAGLTAKEIIAAVKAVERFHSTAIGAGTVTINHDGRGGFVASGEPSGTFVDVARAGIIQKGPPKGSWYANQFGANDFKTAQYWVTAATQTPGRGVTRFTPSADPNYYADQDACVPATNLAEWDIDGGTHLLDPGQAVIVFHLVAPDGADYYVFSLEPDSNVIASITAPADDGDLPGQYLSAAEDTGDPTGMPPAGMDVPGPDVVLYNTAESGCTNAAGATKLNSAWLYIAGQPNAFPGIKRGKQSGGDDDGEPIVTVCAPNPFSTFVVMLGDSSPGDDGNATSPPTYTYTVTALNGDIIGTTIGPQVARPNGSFLPASLGLCYYDQNRDLKLLIAYEVPNTGPCPGDG